MLQSSAFTGAGCVTFNFSSNASSSLSTTLVDFGAFYLSEGAPSAGSCAGTNCTTPSTIAVKPSKYYIFNTTNIGRGPVWSALDYILHPSTSPSKCTMELWVTIIRANPLHCIIRLLSVCPFVACLSHVNIELHLFLKALACSTYALAAHLNGMPCNGKRFTLCTWPGV